MPRRTITGAAWRRAMLALALALAGGAAAEDAGGFVEEFDRIDPARWFVSDGWRNGDHQSCDWSAGAVVATGGVLRLTLGPAAGDAGLLQCGEVQSEARFLYGTVEAAVRLPFAPGTNANLFMFIGPPQGEVHQEIDFEFIARDAPALQTNIYRDGTGGREMLHPVEVPGGWHDLALIWEPGRLRWYLDGALVREETGAVVPDVAQKLYLSLWSTAVMTDWLGLHDPAAGPAVMLVDRVAVTPLGQTCAFAGSILCDPALEGGLPVAAAAP